MLSNLKPSGLVGSIASLKNASAIIVIILGMFELFAPENNNLPLEKPKSKIAIEIVEDRFTFLEYTVINLLQSLPGKI